MERVQPIYTVQLSARGIIRLSVPPVLVRSMIRILARFADAVITEEVLARQLLRVARDLEADGALRLDSFC